MKRRSSRTTQAAAQDGCWICKPRCSGKPCAVHASQIAAAYAAQAQPYNAAQSR